MDEEQQSAAEATDRAATATIELPQALHINDLQALGPD